MRLYLTDILLRELWFYIKKQSRCVCGNQVLLVNQLMGFRESIMQIM